nr:hypothetical protein [Tanacetum cinerariifolium]
MGTTSCSHRSRNTKENKQYYAFATRKAAPKPKASARRKKSGEAAPKPKASVKRTRSSPDTSITPPTAAASPRLTAFAKGKQTAKASKAFKAKSDDNEEKDADNDEEDKGDDGEEVNGDDDDDTRDEESFDPIPQTLEDSEDEGDDEEDLGLNIGEEERHVKEEEKDKLYRDINVNQGRGIQATLEVEDSHMTLTLVNPDVPSNIIQNLPNFGSLFHFDDRLRLLEANFSEFRQTNQFTRAVSFIPGIVNQYMDQRMNEAVKVAVQIQSDRLRDEAQRENDEFLITVDKNIKKIIKEQVKEQVKAQVSKILSRIKQAVNKQLEAKVLTRSSHSSRTSNAVVVDLSGMELKNILIEKMEGNKSIQCSGEQRNLYKAIVNAYESDKIILDTYGETVTLKRRRDDDADKDKEPSAGPDRGSKRLREGKEPESTSTPMETATRSAGRSTQGSRSRQASASKSALAEEPMPTTSQMEEPSHPDFNTGADDQPIVQSSQHPEWFSQQQKPPSLDRDWNKTVPAVHESIQPWICELTKQSDTRSSFNELMDTPLDFFNFLINRLKVDTLTPELLAGPTYELMKGSCKSLIELEYHLEEVFKATTDQLDWVNPKESARDVYSKKRIIAVSELKIVEWHSYKHLDWIMVRRDNDKLYKFKEGDFKRLRIQDIEDMLLLLVQEVCGRPLTGSQKLPEEANLTKPDSYRSGLNRKEAYTAYSNPRGFIYQNKDKRNRLMQIDELHKFSDGTLTDVRTSLDDRLKGIRMQYLPQSIWRGSDKDRAAAMIKLLIRC